LSQIISITSEALQATIRRLLPSQQGFGEDLQASNIITPIIDLTPTAEGSNIPTYMQNALALDSQTAFSVSGTTSDIATSGGFYRVVGVSSIITPTSGTQTNAFRLSDGLTQKNVWAMSTLPSASFQTNITESFDLVVFLDAGDTLTAVGDGNGFLVGSIRQVATLNGTLVNPSPFTPE